MAHPFTQTTTRATFSTETDSSSFRQEGCTKATIDLGQAGRSQVVAAQIAQLPTTTEVLELKGQTPTNETWRFLSRLTSVRDLTLYAGCEERLNDMIPLHWPLKRLEIVDSAGEDVSTPHLLTIHHLILDHTCGLTFKNVDKDKTAMLNSLAIIENDAIDHFIQLHRETCLTANLTELKIESTNGCDYMHQWDEQDFIDVLKQCSTLKTLDLTLDDGIVGEGGSELEKSYLHSLCDSLPPNLETLRFRGPVTLANDLERWKACLHSTSWMPHLKILSFKLDLPLTRSMFDGSSRSAASEEELANAQRACEDLVGGLTELRGSLWREVSDTERHVLDPSLTVIVPCNSSGRS